MEVFMSAMRRNLLFLSIFSFFGLEASGLPSGSDRKRKLENVDKRRKPKVDPVVELENHLATVLGGINPSTYRQDTNQLLLCLSAVIKRHAPIKVKPESGVSYFIPSSLVKSSSVLQNMVVCANNQDGIEAEVIEESVVCGLSKEIIEKIDLLIKGQEVSNLTYQQIIDMIQLMDCWNLDFELLTKIKYGSFAALINYIKEEKIYLNSRLVDGLCKIYGSLKAVDLFGFGSDFVLHQDNCLVSVYSGDNLIKVSMLPLSDHIIKNKCSFLFRAKELLFLKRIANTATFHFAFISSSGENCNTYDFYEVDILSQRARHKAQFAGNNVISFSNSNRILLLSNSLSRADLCLCSREVLQQGVIGKDRYFCIFSNERDALIGHTNSDNNSSEILHYSEKDGSLNQVRVIDLDLCLLLTSHIDILTAKDNIVICKLTSLDTCSSKYTKIIKIDLSSNIVDSLYESHLAWSRNGLEKRQSCILGDYLFFNNYDAGCLTRINFKMKEKIDVCAGSNFLVGLDEASFVVFNLLSNSGLPTGRKLFKYSKESGNSKKLVRKDLALLDGGVSLCFNKFNDSYIISYQSKQFGKKSLNFIGVNDGQVLSIPIELSVNSGERVEAIDVIERPDTKDILLRIHKLQQYSGHGVKHEIYNITDLVPFLDLVHDFNCSLEKDAAASSNTGTSSTSYTGQPVASSSTDE
jgi:hypothetical protein